MKKIIYVGLMFLSLLAMSCSQTETAATKTQTSTTTDNTYPTEKYNLNFDANGVATVTPRTIPFTEDSNVTSPAEKFAKRALITNRAGGYNAKNQTITYRLEAQWGFNGIEYRRPDAQRYDDMYVTVKYTCNAQTTMYIRFIRQGASAQEVANKQPDYAWRFEWQAESFKVSNKDTKYQFLQVWHNDSSLFNRMSHVMSNFSGDFGRNMDTFLNTGVNSCSNPGRTVSGRRVDMYEVEDNGPAGRNRIDLYCGGRNGIFREIYDANSYGFQNW